MAHKSLQFREYQQPQRPQWLQALHAGGRGKRWMRKAGGHGQEQCCYPGSPNPQCPIDPTLAHQRRHPQPCKASKEPGSPQSLAPPCPCHQLVGRSVPLGPWCQWAVFSSLCLSALPFICFFLPPSFLSSLFPSFPPSFLCALPSPFLSNL